MTLKASYTLLAPLYDLIVGSASEPMRRTSLQRLGQDEDVLLCGIGSGLDIPHLPAGNRYTGIDLTPAMLRRASQRAEQQAAEGLQLRLEEGNAMALPFAADSFDCVVMHLIMAVVPQPEQALCEAARVLRPGGRILILDKFLRRGQRAPLRRLLNLLTRHIATRTDVIFEDTLDVCPTLECISDQPVLAGGWFRTIELSKRD